LKLLSSSCNGRAHLFGDGKKTTGEHWKWAQMAGWGGVGSMREGGGLEWRRVVGRLGVGRSFPIKTLIRDGPKKKWNKNCPQKKKKLS
jgi:hypothetical protein